MALQAIIDDQDSTSLTLAGDVRHIHNLTSFATVRQPANLTAITEFSRLKVMLDGVLDFHGMCVHIEDQGDENAAYTTATFADPTFLFAYRPCRDGVGSGDRGDLSKPSFMTRNTTAPAMLQEILLQSLDGSDPLKGEGPMGITLGTFATGGVNLSGMPADWPMTIAQFIALMVETGELDVVCQPTDVGGNMGQISAFNGSYGSDLSATVRFEYGIGSYSARGCRRTVDTKEIVNKLWIYGGPRKGTKADPAGDQHWAFNVTRDDKGLTGYAGFPTVSTAITNSRSTYFVRMMIRIFDGDEAVTLRELYRRWWLMESWVRSRPKTLVAIVPNRGIKPTFRTGDRVHVAAAAKLRGGFAGTQRVQELSYTWTADGEFALGSPVGMPGIPPVVTSTVGDKPA